MVVGEGQPANAQKQLKPYEDRSISAIYKQRMEFHDKAKRLRRSFIVPPHPCIIQKRKTSLYLKIKFLKQNIQISKKLYPFGIGGFQGRQGIKASPPLRSASLPPLVALFGYLLLLLTEGNEKNHLRTFQGNPS